MLLRPSLSLRQSRRRVVRYRAAIGTRNLMAVRPEERRIDEGTSGVVEL
jgi:hypothetical protein